MSIHVRSKYMLTIMTGHSHIQIPPRRALNETTEDHPTHTAETIHFSSSYALYH